MMHLQDSTMYINKENIINYQRKLIQSPFQSLPKPISKNQSKYSICQLTNKVQQLINNNPYNLRWIGNTNNSPIQAYIYCLLMLSIIDNKSLMMFKNIFYQLCRKYLDVKEQKLIIQFLYLLQYSSDKYLFLKKYPNVDLIIFNLFSKLQAEQNSYHQYYTHNYSNQQSNLNNPSQTEVNYSLGNHNSSLIHNNSDSSRYSNSCRVSRNSDNQMDDSATGQLFLMNKLSQLYSKFGTKFNFLKWSKSSQYSFVFTIDDNKKMYIIIQKQYFFVLQLLQSTQIKSPKSKLTKCDRKQVERLLSCSQTESEMSLNQKLNYLSEFAQKNNQLNQSKIKKELDIEANKKSILVCDAKTHTAVQVTGNFKKQYKFSYFSKKTNSKIQQIHENNIGKINSKNNQQVNLINNNLKKQDYIDLMQSSFEEQHNDKIQTNEKDIKQKQKEITKKVQQSNSLKFYKPKFLSKLINSPEQDRNNKKSCDNKPNKSEYAIRGRSPSQIQRYYLTLNLQAKDSKQQKKENKQKMTQDKQQKQDKQWKPLKSKQLKFYSPPKIFSQSPQKNKRDQIGQKKINDTLINDKKKQDFKLFDRKYNQKKQQIHKHYHQQNNKTSDLRTDYRNSKQNQQNKQSNIKNDIKTTKQDNMTKIATSISYNSKIFNNRISLQSRKDLDLLAKYKLPTQQLMLNRIPQANRSQQVSKRQIIQKKKIIRQELSQSLNNKSQVLLKKRLFDHFGSKFNNQNLSFLGQNQSKRNKSLQSNNFQPYLQNQKKILNDFSKNTIQSIHQQCPQSIQSNKENNNIQIRIHTTDTYSPPFYR